MFVVVQYPLKCSFFPVLLVWIFLFNSSSVSCYPSYIQHMEVLGKSQKPQNPLEGNFWVLTQNSMYNAGSIFTRSLFQSKQLVFLLMGRCEAVELWSCVICCPKQHCCFLSSLLPLCFLRLDFLSNWIAVKCLCRWQEWEGGGVWSHCKLQWI